jgi:uncharacterized protein with PIN domain
MSTSTVHLLVADDLLFLVPARRRRGQLELRYDGTSSLGHLVQSAGVPLPEVGRLRAGAVDVSPEHRPRPDEVFHVDPVSRPTPLPAGAGFVLDVHLGSLARRMRVLGLDARYDARLDDDDLVALAVNGQRTLLTKDRGLLRRRALRTRSAYVRGDRVDEQLRDVLDRFAPPLDPFSRCPSCNGPLRPAGKQAVMSELEPGTARSYDEFVRCGACGHVYWSGAHAAALDRVVAAARAQLREIWQARPGEADSCM